jgi:hypothetical protein
MYSSHPDSLVLVQRRCFRKKLRLLDYEVVGKVILERNRVTHKLRTGTCATVTVMIAAAGDKPGYFFDAGMNRVGARLCKTH